MLSEAGFRPHSLTAQIVADCVKAAFGEMGESTGVALTYHLARIHNLPEDVILTRYDLIEKSTRTVFGYGADYLLDSIRNKLLAALPGADSKISTIEIVRQAQIKETESFIRNIEVHEHLIFLHTKDNNKDKILSPFLDHGAAGVIQRRGRSFTLPLPVKTAYYEDVLKSNDKAESMKRLGNWIAGLGSSEANGIRVV